jgi:RNA-directed DNA polymerase
MRDAVGLKAALEERFGEVGLAINNRKSHIVYIDTFERRNVKSLFTFLGYDFQVRTLKNYKVKLYRKCMPGRQSKP